MEDLQNNMMWFSAMLVFAIHVEDVGVERTARSLILFKSTNDFEEAKKSALKVGLSKEESYKNGDEKLVQWKLMNIETLDLLGEEIDDLKEVYSEFRDVDHEASRTLLSDMNPEASKPTQTGI